MFRTNPYPRKFNYKFKHDKPLPSHLKTVDETNMFESIIEKTYENITNVLDRIQTPYPLPKEQERYKKLENAVHKIFSNSSAIVSKI